MSERPLWIVRVSGTQEEMGRRHGELLAQAGGADAVLRHYKDMPARLVSGGEAGAARTLSVAAVRGVSEVLLARLAADRPAELRGRSRAFMRGLGVPAATDRYLGVMDLFQNFVGTAARWGLGPFKRPARAMMSAAAAPACSTVMAWGAATDDGTVRHARNFDFPGVGVWDASPAVVLCAPAQGMRYGFVTTRGADTPVVTVFNEAGLVITSHTRFHTAVAFKGASVVDLVHDIGRRAESLADAERIARERPVASSWGLAVSSARERRGVVLEIHAGAVRVVEPAAGNEHVVCCNRYRHPEMQDGQVASTPAWALHSDRRERRLHALVADARARGGADWRALAAMLTDRRDADSPDVERQLGGIVAQPCQVQSIVVAPDARALWLGTAAAPVGEGRWVRLSWEWSGQGGAWELGHPVPAGMGVTVEDAGALARHPASDAVAAALAIDQQSHDSDAMAAEIERAVAAAPADPSPHTAMMWLEMRRGGWMRAVAHAESALDVETLPYRRGQLYLWGARAAAAAGDTARADRWRAALAALGGDGLQFLQQKGARDAGKPAAAFHRKPVIHLTLLEASY
jgi:hypothetical protein